MDNVVINKASIIERCIERVREEYGGDPTVLEENITKQDAIVLNIQRACEATIDLAMHLCRSKKLGVPQDSRDAFSLLIQEGALAKELGQRLKAMVGFRNIAVHDYQKVSLPIVRSIIATELQDLQRFASLALRSNC